VVPLYARRVSDKVIIIIYLRYDFDYSIFMPKRSRNTSAKKKNAAAVALGRAGGLKGGPARAKKLSAKERSESARQAALARWRGEA